MDWKDALSQISGLPEGKPDNDAPEAVDTPATPSQKSPLHVLIEKKGRGGKTATIVEGFEIPDQDIDLLARDMRKKLGTGGSARGGEILIQGDRISDVKAFLQSRGFKTK